ncbi:protease inhibitor-like [Mytilus edulis]|uniref:protease inhibitor-like n=1 Tax=Mytilus edulis TaxID=6550 RepID=UPI0039F1480F
MELHFKILMFIFVISVLVHSGVNGAQAGTGGTTIKKNVCNQRKDSGPCGETDIRFFFNSKTEQCEEFTFGGCKGNANNFRTKEVCIKHCVCNLRPDPGPCEGSFT